MALPDKTAVFALGPEVTLTQHGFSVTKNFATTMLLQDGVKKNCVFGRFGLETSEK